MEKVDGKADVRKEPPVPEAPVVKVVSESPPEVKANIPEESKPPPVEEIKKISPPAVDEQPVPKKEETIHHDAIKKEDDEIKEVQKQEIFKKKEELIEKLEENEEKQKRLLEEQKKILQDIKLEKEKLVEENKQLRNVEKEKEINKNRLNAQNEVIADEKKEVPNVIVKKAADITPVKNTVEVAETKVVKKLEQEVKETMKIIKDDVVKKNMAEGIPLPIAVQHMIPHVERLKSAKIVDNNLAKPDEGNLDSKVLRREILENSNFREQREKRDIVEVINIDLKESEKVKDNIKEGENNAMQKLKELKINKIAELKENMKVSLVTIKPVVMVELKPANKETENIFEKDVSKIDSSKKEKVVVKVQANEIPPQELKKDSEDCPDKNKSVLKFADELKPLETSEIEKKVKDGLAKPLQDTKASSFHEGETQVGLKTKNIGRKEETMESIIKMPAFLSNPKLVLPSAKLEESVIESGVNNVAKPMKRDLKSLDLTQNQSTKERET